MSIYTLLFTIISVCLLFFYLIDLLIENKITNDLLFFILLTGILSGILIVFYYYFQDTIISLITSFFLMLNTYLLTREIKKIENRYVGISIPFFILSIYFFSYILSLLI